MGTFNDEISPMGYNLGGDPKNKNPFFEFSGGGGGTAEIPDDLLSEGIDFFIGSVQTTGTAGQASINKHIDMTSSPYKVKYYLNLTFPESGGGSGTPSDANTGTMHVHNTWLWLFQHIEQFLDTDTEGGITGALQLQGSMIFNWPEDPNIASWVSYYAGSAVEGDGVNVDPTFSYRTEYLTSISNWVASSNSYVNFTDQSAGLPLSDEIRFNDDAARITIFWEPAEDEQIAGIDRKITTTVYLKYEDEDGSSNKHEEVRIQFELFYDSTSHTFYLAPDIGQDVDLGVLEIHDFKTPYISQNNVGGTDYRFTGTQIQHIMMRDVSAQDTPDRYAAATNLLSRLSNLANIYNGVLYVTYRQ